MHGTGRADGAPLLTVLVPVRNGETELPRWLASVADYADDVIALDDGSTDGTRRILENNALVSTVLENRVRSSYVGWDDRENRQRLVDAATARGARWALFLDADERLHQQDGCALRTFLQTEAHTGFAYGFEVFRMVDDEHHYDPRGMWVFRLFHCDDAEEPMPPNRLHFVPVPAGIERARWLQTSLRIQHFGSLTESRRRDRFEKYALADPHDEYRQGYERLLEGPEIVEPWPERRLELPVLLGVRQRYADLLGTEPDSTTSIAISAVVIAQNDAAVIDRSITALTEQVVSDPFEVILVDSGDDDTVAQVTGLHPSVRCVHLPDPALPGEARNAGLYMARGEYVTFPGSHVWLTEGSLQTRLEAHDDGWAMVTGAVVNGNAESRGAWASYFLDHATQMPGQSSGEFIGVPGHASYVTDDLRRVGGFPEHVRAGEDTIANRKLYLAGAKTFFCGGASFHHASPCRSLRDVMRHHYQRGRGLGRMIAAGNPRRFSPKRFRAAKNAAQKRLGRIHEAMENADGDLLKHYRAARFHVLAGAFAAMAGSVRELGRRGAEIGPDELVLSPVAAAGSGPLLALGGRPGFASSGMLAVGGPAAAAQRLATFARYARHETDVLAAMAPIVTSAMVTAEYLGTYTMEMDESTVETYLDATRSIGASLLLQIQPGRAHLVDLIDRWEELLLEPDVGVLFDLRAHLAHRNQVSELPAAVDRLQVLIGGESAPVQRVHVRGVNGDEIPESVVIVEAVDLREPGSLFPHELFAARPNTTAVIYD